MKYRKDRPIYERQSGEKRFAWRAFVLYRDIGPDRTLWAVCKPLQDLFSIARQSDHTKKYPHGAGVARRLETWWKENRWWDRAGAWDRAKAAEKDHQKRIDLEEMEKRHVMESQALQHKGLQALQAMNPSILHPREVLRYLEVAMKLEAMARGKPESIRQTQVTGKSGGPIQTVNAHAHGGVGASAPVRVTEILVTTREEVKALLERGLMSGADVIGGV